MKIKKLRQNIKSGLFSGSLVTVKEMGNQTEVKYMINRNGGLIKKIDKNNYYDIRTGEVKKFKKDATTRNDNKESVRRSLRNLRDIINTNIVDYKNILWVTLTYKENMKDYKNLYNDYRKFYKRLERYLSKNNLPKSEYIATAEPQNRGAWHLHILFIFEDKAPFIENKILSKLWGHGFVSITSLKGIDNVGVYLTAYLSNLEITNVITDEKTNSKAVIKGLRIKLYPKGFRIYRCSKGIKKPNVYETTEENAMISVKDTILTYEKTIQLLNDDGKIINTINYRNYNKKPNRKGNKYDKKKHDYKSH